MAPHRTQQEIFFYNSDWLVVLMVEGGSGRLQLLTPPHPHTICQYEVYMSLWYQVRAYPFMVKIVMIK